MADQRCLHFQRLNSILNFIVDMPEVDIDEKWFLEYKKIKDFSYVECFSVDKKYREKIRKAFVNGEDDSPLFKYHELVNFPFDEKKQMFKDLSEAIEKEEKNKIVAKLYQAKIVDQVLELDMMHASQTGDDKKFGKFTEKIHGKPKKEILEKVIPSIKKMIADVKEKGIDELDKSIAYLEEVFSKEKGGGEEIFELMSEEKHEDYVDAEYIKEVFEKAVKDLNLSGWDVIIDEEQLNTHIYIDQHRQNIVIPGRRKMRPAHLEALIDHEVGVHVIRRRNGEDTNLKLARAGLAAYIRTEEGLGVYAAFKKDPLGLMGSIEVYLGLALVYGLLGHPKTFKEVYDFYYHYFRVSRVDGSKKGESRARSYAWKRCLKLYRGTTAQTKGIAFTRGVIYLEGYFKMRDFLKAHPEKEEEVLKAKYDPTNNQHVKALQGLGILT